MFREKLISKSPPNFCFLSLVCYRQVSAEFQKEPRKNVLGIKKDIWEKVSKFYFAIETNWYKTYGCSPVNLLLVFRTPFPRNTSEWLRLHIVSTKRYSWQKKPMAEITQYKQVNNLFSFWSINTKNRTSKTGSEEWKVILIKSLFLL